MCRSSFLEASLSAAAASSFSSLSSLNFAADARWLLLTSTYMDQCKNQLIHHCISALSAFWYGGMIQHIALTQVAKCPRLAGCLPASE